MYAVALQECSQGKAWQKALEEHVGAESLTGLGFAKPVDTSSAPAGTGAGAGAGAGATVEFNDEVTNINDLDDDDFDGEEFVQGRGQRFRRQAESILSLNTARLSLADADAANRGHTEAIGGFRTVASVSLWNIHLIVMVRTALAPRITEVRQGSACEAVVRRGLTSRAHACRCTRARWRLALQASWATRARAGPPCRSLTARPSLSSVVTSLHVRSA